MDVFCQICGAKHWEVTPTPFGNAQDCGGVVGGLFFLTFMALGALWGLIALVKWFWNRS
jgi:hypothetical protein